MHACTPSITTYPRVHKFLFLGFKDKILQSFKGSFHDKMSQKILEKYRSLPKKMYKHKKTVPTFSEFIEYVLDLYKKNGEIDMHWAPVVNFCSVCKVSKLFNTYVLH